MELLSSLPACACQMRYCTSAFFKLLWSSHYQVYLVSCKMADCNPPPADACHGLEHAFHSIPQHAAGEQKVMSFTFERRQKSPNLLQTYAIFLLLGNGNSELLSEFEALVPQDMSSVPRYICLSPSASSLTSAILTGAQVMNSESAQVLWKCLGGVAYFLDVSHRVYPSIQVTKLSRTQCPSN